MMLALPIILEKVLVRGHLAMRKSDMNKCVKKAFEAVGAWWLKNRLPHHFTQAGATDYGYAPRTRGYLKTKRRREGFLCHGMRPLVYEGTLERQVKKPWNQNVIANKNGVTIRLRHYQIRREQHAELTRVTPEETARASAVYADALRAELKAFTGRRTIRLKAGE
jgi:hypothetical protein